MFNSYYMGNKKNITSHIVIFIAQYGLGLVVMCANSTRRDGPSERSITETFGDKNTRRRFLQGLGAAGAVGLAGCSAEDPENGGATGYVFTPRTISPLSRKLPLTS